MSSAPPSLVPHVIIDDFLGAARAAELLAFAQARESGFLPAKTRRKDADVDHSAIRNSLRLDAMGAVKDAFSQAVDGVFEQTVAALGLGALSPTIKEIEMLWNGDGCFYKKHKDTITQEHCGTGVRALTFVYYFHRTPQRFSGGAIRLFPVFPVQAGAGFIDVEPRCDRLVAFPSFFPHEVMPVAARAAQFADGRFSINCWIHKPLMRG